MDLRRHYEAARAPLMAAGREDRSGTESGSGPFAGTIPHGDAEPASADQGAEKRQVEHPRGSSDAEPHEQSENSPLRPRQAGIDPAARGRTDRPHKSGGEELD